MLDTPAPGSADSSGYRPGPAAPAGAVPPPPAGTGPKRSRWVKVAVGVGAAAGVAVGATVLAGAATSSSPAASSSSSGATADASGGTSGGTSNGSSGSSSTPPAPSGPAGRPGGFGRGGGFAFGLGGPGGRVLHGEYTIQGPSGYETLEEQTGTVSAISETDTSSNTWSLTVQSADSTAITYVVDSSTNVDSGEIGISDVTTGDTVNVLAVVSNGTSTAKQLNDTTKVQANRQPWVPVPPGDTTPPSSSSPTPSST